MGLSATAIAHGQAAAPAIPVVALPDAAARSTELFGAIGSVRELPGGNVLVDDAARKQIKLLSATLATTSTLKDTVRGEPNWYGPRIMPLIPFLGDSTLFPEIMNRVVNVFDPQGRLTRSLAMPNPIDVAFLRRAYADDKGRVLFGGEPRTLSEEIGKQPVVADSMPVIRADFAARRNDTLGYLARPLIAANATNPVGNGAILAYFNPDPLATTDEWTVISDGSLALIRGHDYHIDWIRSDGTKESTPKMPFDWRQLSEADKAKMLDSAEALRAMSARSNTLVNGIEKLVPWKGTGANQDASRGTARYPQLDTTGALRSRNNGNTELLVFKNPRPSIDRVYDYYPPMRSDAALADMDNHLWILPTTSKQSQHGELVYDIVNTKGALFQRVRVPMGRYIVGFGRNGTVYLASGSVRSGFTLERSALPK